MQYNCVRQIVLWVGFCDTILIITDGCHLNLPLKRYAVWARRWKCNERLRVWKLVIQPALILGSIENVKAEIWGSSKRNVQPGFA